MKKAVQEGRWCWKAPTGYHFQNDQFRKPLLHPSSESEFIKEAFTLIEQGFYSQKEVTEILARKGFKVSTQTMNKILHNPIYAGLIRTKWYPELIEGIHEPLISRETFFNVQKILLGDKPSLAPKRKDNPDFPLRGFVLCPDCGSPLTASVCKGKTTRIAYYWCWKNNCIPMTQQKIIENQFCEYLNNIQPKPEIMELLEYKLVHHWKEKNQHHKNQLKRDKTQLTELKSMKENLLNKLLKGVIDDDTYKEKVDALQNEILMLQENVSQGKVIDYDLEAYLKFSTYFLTNISDIWRKSAIKTKQRIQNFVFPAQIYFDGVNFEPPQLVGILDVINNFFRRSNLATPRGFEPLLQG
ncbi:MAG: recombinase family protein [bacterium]|nr:recombinase family protein [bacterium]